MRRVLIKPERVAGIVALSYLVLIPAAGYFLHKAQKLDAELITELYTRVETLEKVTLNP